MKKIFFKVRSILGSCLILSLAFAPAQLVTAKMSTTQNEQIKTLYSQAEQLSAAVTQIQSENKPLFKIGENIKIVTSVQVKKEATPNSEVMGLQKIEQTGVIIAGPITSGGSVWWKINFAVGVDGWISDNWMVSTESSGETILQKYLYSLPAGQSTVLEAGVSDAKVSNINIPAASIERTITKVTMFAAIKSSKFASKPWSDFETASLWNGTKNIWSKNIGAPGSWVEVQPVSQSELQTIYKIVIYTGNLKIPVGVSYKLDLKISVKAEATSGNIWDMGVMQSGVEVSTKIGSRLYGQSSAKFSVEIKETQPVYDIIIIAGQSNAVGFNRPSTDTYSESVALLKQKSNIYQVGRFGKNALKIVPATDPLEHWSYVQEGRGFGVPFALRYAKDNPGRRVLLVPAAQGGVTIRLWDKVVDNFTWVDKSDSTLLYDDMIKRVTIAMKKNSNSKVVAVLWQQGEADVNVLAENNPDRYYFAAEGVKGYGKKLDELRRNIRTDLKISCLPFLAGEMPQAWAAVNKTAQPYIQKGIVTEKIKSVMAADNCKKSVFVPSAGAPSNPGSSMNAPDAVDGGAVHFSAVGEYTMAQKYYEGFVNLQFRDY